MENNFNSNQQTPPPPPPINENHPNNDSDKKLYRSKNDRILWGVCGGLGKYFGLDALIFRLIFVALTLSGGAGILFYIVLAIVIPNEPETIADTNQRDEKLKQFVGEVGEKVRNLASEIKIIDKHKNDSRLFIGFFIFFVGLILLLRLVFPWHFYWLNGAILWPIVIILIGLYLMLKK
ncbi:MAG TPA: PspC domain-containing protein [bacterium]|nr:PspC domain-containing protein [bacterium]HPL95426.1 PspC domain-containing protein [bacterium]